MKFLLSCRACALVAWWIATLGMKFGFCPPLDQFSGVHWMWLRGSVPPTSPRCGWCRLPSLFGISVVLAVAVSSVPWQLVWSANIILLYVSKAVNGYCVPWLATIFFSFPAWSPWLPHPNTGSLELIASLFQTGTGLRCTICKIPVNFSLSLDLEPGTGNSNKRYRKFRLFR